MSIVVSQKARQLAAVLVEQLGRQQARALTREGRQAVALALAWTGTDLELDQVLAALKLECWSWTDGVVGADQVLAALEFEPEDWS